MRFTLMIAPLVLCTALAAFGTAEAQQCGPGCPACSGKAIGDLLPSKTILFSGMYIPEGDEQRGVLNVRYGLTTWIDAGIGYVVPVEHVEHGSGMHEGMEHESTEHEIIWSVRVQPLAQDRDGWRPALILGTGSIQVGGSDQSAFVQVVKTLEVIEGRFGISAAGGYATDVPDFEENWILGTCSATLYDRVSPFYTYDGMSSHIGISFFPTNWLILTGYYLEMEEPAVWAGLQLSFGGEGEE